MFCQSYNTLIELYSLVALEIGKRDKFYVKGSDLNDCRVCDKYDACTTFVHQSIIKSFTKPDGNLRLILLR